MLFHMQRVTSALKTHGQWIMVVTALGTAITTAVLDRFFPEGTEAAKKSHEAVSATMNTNTKAIEDAVADLDDALMREKERRRMVERRVRDIEERVCGRVVGPPPPAAAPPVASEGEGAEGVEAPEPVAPPKPATRSRVRERLRAAVKQAPNFDDVYAP